MPAINPREMTQEQRDAFHRQAEADVYTFDYKKPEPNERPKQIAWLVRRPHMQVVVQCVRDGGENNLHYHTNSETTWFVLKGKAVFTGPEGKIWGELEPMQGIVMPGGARYKFTKVGDEDLEILQMVAVHQPGDGEAERINLEAHREWMADEALQRY